jgi:hypothetical protein
MTSYLQNIKIFGLATLLLTPAFLFAQQQPAGVVTTLQGTAELSRPTRPTPTALRFKEDVFVRDVINTREKSLARVLFGGKSTVTVRELSRLEVREEAIPGGGTRSIHELSSGAILVNVAKQLMRPGDEVQIRTPNAVASIRGTIVFCDCRGSGEKTTCDFSTLTGSMTLTPNGGAARSLSGNSAGAESATVSGDSPANIQITPTTIMEPTQVVQVMRSFEGPLAPPNQPQNGSGQLQQAADLANAVVAAVTGGTTSDNPLVQNAATSLENTSGLTDNLIPPPPSNPGPTTAPLSPINSCKASCAALISGAPTPSGGGLPPMWVPDFGGSVAALAQDDRGAVLPLPFSFPFRGQSFDQIVLSTNGFLFLGNSTNALNIAGDFTATVSEFLGSPAPRVALVWSDLYTPGGGFIRYNNTLSDRVIITWEGVPFFPFSSSSSPVNNIQMQLLSDGKIIFSYQNLQPLVTTASNTALIGVTPGNGAADPEATNFGSAISFSTGSEGSVYEFFQGQGTQFGLDGMSIIFTPNGNGGWDVLVDDVDAFLSLAQGDVVNHLGTSPLINFSKISLNLGGHFWNQSGGTVTLGGSLLSATDSVLKIGSDPTVAGDLVSVRSGGQIVMNSDAPLIQLSGGTLTIGTRDGTANDSPNHLIYIGGVNLDLANGLGSDRPIRGAGLNQGSQSVGTLFEATNGATIEVLKGAGDTSGGNAIRLDSALLEATLPLINMVGSPTAFTSLTTDGSTIDLFKSKVISNGPVIALDRGIINVNNGALINVTDGSQLITPSDIINMTSGSRINVFNGPLINVTGTGSLLDAGGALVNFGGTGGNRIVVNNSIAPTATPSGLPVSATNGGSINIGRNPIVNPSLGTITVNNGGSLIQATNGGQVNIRAR